MADHRLTLTEDEYQVLIEMFNSLADRNISRRHRVKGEQRFTLEVRPFIRKLLKLGLRAGWTQVPACYRGPKL